MATGNPGAMRGLRRRKHMELEEECDLETAKMELQLHLRLASEKAEEITEATDALFNMCLAAESTCVGVDDYISLDGTDASDANMEVKAHVIHLQQKARRLAKIAHVLNDSANVLTQILYRSEKRIKQAVARVGNPLKPAACSSNSVCSSSDDASRT